MTSHLHEKKKINCIKTKASSPYSLIGMKHSQVEKTLKDIL